MVKSSSFRSLWADPKFTAKLATVIIDEAHCIHEWGEDFRDAYRELASLRVYTGLEIPMAACSATLPTETFNDVWTSLGFGHRPFYGVDVGTQRDNLTYIIRPIDNPSNPALDLIGTLPLNMGAETPKESIKKTLLYLGSPEACRAAVDTFRKCLPPHLRGTVQNFSSGLSPDGKRDLWRKFARGEVRILCCTDAVGMGCNVPDIAMTVVAGPVTSLSVLSQRWGRAGRGRQTAGVCIWLAPKWVWRPNLTQQPSRGKGKKVTENKSWAASRARMQTELEAAVNLRHNAEQGSSIGFTWQLEVVMNNH